MSEIKQPVTQASDASPDPFASMEAQAIQLERIYSTAARLAKSAPGHEARAFDHAIEVLTGLNPGKLMRPAIPQTVSEVEENQPRRAPKASGAAKAGGAPRRAAQASPRIKPILEAEPQKFAEWVKVLPSLNINTQVRGLMRMAREFGVDGLTPGDLYFLVDKLKLGIRPGTVRMVLSTADFAEIGFKETAEGRLYSLNIEGDKGLDAAIAKAKAKKGKDEATSEASGQAKLPE